MRNIIVSVVALVALTAIIGFGASSIRSQFSDLRKQVTNLTDEVESLKGGTRTTTGGSSESGRLGKEFLSIKNQLARLQQEVGDLKKGQPSPKKTNSSGGSLKITPDVANVLSQMKKDIDELRSRAGSTSAPVSSGAPTGALAGIEKRLAKLEEVVQNLDTPHSETSKEAKLSPAAVEARKKRCKYVEEYLVELEKVYEIKNEEERTAARIGLEEKYKHTRAFLLEGMKVNWIDAYEDALQAVYFIDDPVRKVTGKAKINALRSKIIDRCFGRVQE